MVIRRKSVPRFLLSAPSVSCIKNGVLDDKINIIGRIGTDSAYGEAYAGCFPKNCKNSIAIKKIPLTYNEYLYKDHSENKEVLNKSESWAEIYFLKLVGSLNKQNIIGHVPNYYKYYICNDCSYLNENISKKIRAEGKCIILPNDLADGDLKYFINNYKLSISKLFDSYLQIFMGIYAIKKYFGIQHNDLHWGNILFKKVPNGVNKYTINKKNYYVPNNGMLFFLWDFGMSTIPGVIEPRKASSSKKDNEDYLRIISMMLPDSPTSGSKSKSSVESLNKNLALDTTYLILKSYVKNFSDKTKMMEYYLDKAAVPYKKGLVITGKYNLDKKLNTKGLTIYK
jgi:hypothetical protein